MVRIAYTYALTGKPCEIFGGHTYKMENLCGPKGSSNLKDTGYNFWFDWISQHNDAGCGEGYYTAHVLHTLQAQGASPSVCGVDISRDALICAHRRAPELTLAVASIAHLPVADASCDLVLNVFAPHDAAEFARVLRPQGVLLRVIPLERHLWGLKRAVYDHPYENTVPDPALPGFALAEQRTLRGTITLRTNADIEALFCMTPYYYKSGARDQAKLHALDTLTTETEFALLIYRKA